VLYNIAPIKLPRGEGHGAFYLRSDAAALDVLLVLTKVHIGLSLSLKQLRSSSGAGFAGAFSLGVVSGLVALARMSANSLQGKALAQEATPAGMEFVGSYLLRGWVMPDSAFSCSCDARG
jgi:hypothetical protein